MDIRIFEYTYLLALVKGEAMATPAPTITILRWRGALG